MARTATGSNFLRATAWSVPSGPMHVFMLVKNTAPPAVFARIFEASGTTVYRDGTSGANGDWHFIRKWSGTNGEWICTNANAGVDLTSFTLLDWYQDGTTTGLAKFGVNGTAKTVSTVNTPVGTVSSAAATLDIANRNAHDRAWGTSGAIAWFGVYTRELTGTEKTGILSGTIPLDSCLHFYALDATYGLHDLINSSGDLTDSGSIVAADPATTLLLWPAPTGLAAGTPTASSIPLSWTANTGATSYVLERNGGSGWSVIATPSGTTYTDTGLTASTTYQYRVRASSAVTSGQASSTVSQTTSAAAGGAPATPTNVAPQGTTATSTGLAWDASTGATVYGVQRSADGGASYTLIATPTSNSYTDTGLTPSTTYQYQVQAINGSSSSAWSSGVTVVTAALTTLPTVVRGGSMYDPTFVMPGAITLTCALWGMPDADVATIVDAQNGGFRIYRTRDGAFHWRRPYNSGALLASWAWQLAAHQFRVGEWNQLAFVHIGGTASPILYLNGQPIPLTVERAPSGTLDTGATTLTWLNNAGETLPWDGDGLGDSAITALGVYSVALDATSVRGISIFGRYPIPNLLRLYPMVRDDDPNAGGATYPLLDLFTFGPASSVVPTTTYGAEVSANQANAILHNVTIPPTAGALRLVYWAAPTNPTVANGSTGPVLTWLGTPGATSYTIERTASDTWATLTTTSGTTYTDTSAVSGTLYRYRVRASNGVVLGEATDALVIRFDPNTAPTLPPPWAVHPLFVGYYTPAGQMVLDASCRLDDITIETNDHGYHSCAVEIPMRVDQALAYATMNGPLECRVSMHGRRLHVGRVENPGVKLSDGASMLTMTSYGYQVAFSDMRYSAFWSTAKLDGWQTVMGVDQPGFDDGRFDTSTGDTGLTVIFHNGNLPGTGGMQFTTPNGSRTQITMLEIGGLQYLPATWNLVISSSQRGSTDLHPEVTIPGVNYPADFRIIQPITPCDRVVVAIVGDNGTMPVDAGELSYFIRADSVHIYHATQPYGLVDPADILTDIVALQASVNPTQLQANAAYIKPSGFALLYEANYEDADGRDVLNDLISYGGGYVDDGPYGWAVWEKNQIVYGPLSHMGRTWYVDVETFEWERSLSDLYNSVYTVTDTARSAATTNAASVQRYGITRNLALSVTASPSVDTDTQVQLQLADSSDPLPRTSLSIGRIVFDAHGAPHPSALVRGLDQIVVRNLAARVPAAAKFRTFRVVHTSLKPKDGTNDLTLESPTPALQWMLNRAKVGI